MSLLSTFTPHHPLSPPPNTFHQGALTIIFWGDYLSLKTRKIGPTLSTFNPCPSLQSIATNNRKQFQYLSIILTKLDHYVLNSVYAKRRFNFSKRELIVWPCPFKSAYDLMKIGKKTSVVSGFISSSKSDSQKSERFHFLSTPVSQSQCSFAYCGYTVRGLVLSLFLATTTAYNQGQK